MAMLAVVLQLARDLPWIESTRNPGAVKCRVTEDLWLTSRACPSTSWLCWRCLPCCEDCRSSSMPHGAEVAKVKAYWSLLVTVGVQEIRKCVFCKFHVLIRVLDFDGHCAPFASCSGEGKISSWATLLCGLYSDYQGTMILRSFRISECLLEQILEITTQKSSMIKMSLWQYTLYWAYGSGENSWMRARRSYLCWFF